MSYDPTGTREFECCPYGDCYYCKKTTYSESNYYDSSTNKVAVIYDGRYSGILYGLFGGTGFSYQGKWTVDQLSSSYEVEEYSFTTMEGFINSWNSLEGSYREVHILCHGYPGGLSCNDKSIDLSNTKEYSFDVLEPISVGYIQLNSCNGATLSNNTSVAQYLAKLSSAPVQAVANGGVGFLYRTGTPYTKSPGLWTWTTKEGLTTYRNPY